jgi:hypothetical protein
MGTMKVATEPEIDRSWSAVGIVLFVGGFAIAAATFVLANLNGQRGPWLHISAAIGVGLAGVGLLAQQARHPVIGAVGAVVLGLDVAAALLIALIISIIAP